MNLLLSSSKKKREIGSDIIAGFSEPLSLDLVVFLSDRTQLEANKRKRRPISFLNTNKQ